MKLQPLNQEHFAQIIAAYNFIQNKAKTELAKQEKEKEQQANELKLLAELQAKYGTNPPKTP